MRAPQPHSALQPASLPSAGSAEGLLGAESNPMLMVALGIGGVVLLVVLLVAVSGGGQRWALARSAGDSAPAFVEPSLLPSSVRDARLTMFITGGLLLITGVGIPMGFAFLAAARGLRRPTRGAYAFAVGLQVLLLLIVFLAAVLWMAFANWNPIGLVAAFATWSVPLALSSIALFLLYQSRDYYRVRA
ncbi:hypothetical protein [Streptomonospora sediminis]